MYTFIYMVPHIYIYIYISLSSYGDINDYCPAGGGKAHAGNGVWFRILALIAGSQQHHTYLHACMHTYIYIYTHKHIFTFTYISIYIYTHKYIHIFLGCHCYMLLGCVPMFPMKSLKAFPTRWLIFDNHKVRMCVFITSADANQVWTILDSQYYLLPQRRNRVWGLAFLITGQDTVESVDKWYKQALLSLRSNFQFPVEQIFRKRPEEPPSNKRIKALVDIAKTKYPYSNNVFIDASSSIDWQHDGWWSDTLFGAQSWCLLNRATPLLAGWRCFECTGALQVMLQPGSICSSPRTSSRDRRK